MEELLGHFEGVDVPELEVPSEEVPHLHTGVSRDCQDELRYVKSHLWNPTINDPVFAIEEVTGHVAEDHENCRSG